MDMCRHWAFCVDTGEVLGSSTNSGLRRSIKRNVAWDIKHGLPRKSWRFHHGSYEELGKKFR